MFGKRKRNKDEAQEALLEQAQTELIGIFEKMPYEVPLVLFTSPAKNEVFNQACRQIIRAIRQFTPKITLREYDIDHKMAAQWNVAHAPTLLYDPERYRVRWLGAPMGEEGRTLVQALIMMGYRETQLSDQSIKVLNRIGEPRHVKVFVSLSCPYCPQQAVNALKAALAIFEDLIHPYWKTQASPPSSQQA